MKVSVRNVGNSRGIIIPSPLLASCEIGDEVELHVEGKRLIVEAVHAPRAGWFAGYKKEEADPDVLEDLPFEESSIHEPSIHEDKGEWQW